MGAGEAFCASCPGETRGKGKVAAGLGNVEVLGDENKNGARGARGQGTGGKGEWPMEEGGGQSGVEVCRLTTEFTYTVVFL